MSNPKISNIQLNIWIITATIAPIIFYCDGNWVGTILWSIPIGFLVWCAMHFGQHWGGGIYNVVQCLWLSVVLSQLLGYSAECWPTGERTFPVVPLVLLMLATATSLKGSKCTASGISVLFWVMAFLLGVVVAAGVPELNGNYFVASADPISAPMMLALLLPSAAGFLVKEKTGKLSIVTVVVSSVSIAIWISCILSPEIAESVKWPFYEAAKGVQLFDVAKRLESLVSAGITVGNYALYSLLLCGVRDIGDRFQKGIEAVITATGISASLVLLNVVVDPAISVVVCFVLWIFLPLLGIMKRNGHV